jgi:hypothetical protein
VHKRPSNADGIPSKYLLEKTFSTGLMRRHCAWLAAMQFEAH